MAYEPLLQLLPVVSRNAGVQNEDLACVRSCHFRNGICWDTHWHEFVFVWGPAVFTQAGRTSDVWTLPRPALGHCYPHLFPICRESDIFEKECRTPGMEGGAMPMREDSWANVIAAGFENVLHVDIGHRPPWYGPQAMGHIGPQAILGHKPYRAWATGHTGPQAIGPKAI